MKLTIHSTGKPLHRPAAALIRGSNAATWLQEISRYNLPLSAIDCYVLPQSIHSIAAAGLFAIFNNSGDVEKLSLPNAYGVLAGKLYLPVDATLYPQLSAAELEKILMWPVQVFHPTIGFVGFEESDKLNFTRLFTWTLPQKTTWRQAHAGLPALPGLQQIMVVQPTPEEIIEQAKQDLQAKPLEDIPGGGEAPDTLTGKIAESIKKGFFTGLSAMARLLEKLPLGTGGGTGGGGSLGNLPGGKGGWLQRLMKWVDENMEAIEKKRQTELQRLMNMFDKDSDEALQYAIPLTSPYLDRGQAPPSSRLGRRDTNFSLGRLGGGGRVDGWDLGDYHQRLREKYLASAQAAIAKGDFKKAAYVHAHLLGDYNAAANVLMQGGFYREASALYKDHLKNNLAAAECLEKGGLLAEATTLYLQMDRLEKAGDLYEQMQQPDKATACYEQVVGSLITNNDQLEAARIIQHKMQQERRARQTLLQGWEGGNKAEACLKKYYDLVAETEAENLEQHLEAVYAKAQNGDNRFLNVLVHVRERYAGVEATSKKMAYEIVSKQAADGNTANLHQLKSFLPQDKFISGDASRFISRQKKPQISKPEGGIKLNSGIQWVDATYYRNQLIAIGVLNGHLRLARANWYGNVEYFSWFHPIGARKQFSFSNKNPFSKSILLSATEAKFFEKKVLPKDRYFNDEIKIDSPAWIEDVRFVIAVEDGFVFLERNYHPVLHFYNNDGAIVNSVQCKSQGIDTYKFNLTSKIVYWNDFFYVDAGHHIAMIHKNGSFSSCAVRNGIEDFAVSKSLENEWIVAYSSYENNCACHVLRSNNGILDLDHYADFEVDKGFRIVRFISDNVFILIGELWFDKYRIDNVVTFLDRITVDSPIIEAIPVPHQAHFGLVHQNGVVSLHSL